MSYAMDIFDPEQVVTAEANSRGSMTVSDCLVQCWFTCFCDTELQNEGIFLDPVYTGKAMVGVLCSDSFWG